MWDFPWYVTPRLLAQATALTSFPKAPLSAVTKEPAAVTCVVHSELYFYSSTVPGASVNSAVRVIQTMMIVMILTPSVPTRLWELFLIFDVHVTVHRDKFLVKIPTRCTNFSNFFLKWNSTCFGQFLCPSSGVFHCTHSNLLCHTSLLTAASRIRMEPCSMLILLANCQQTCMTYTIAVCTVKNSWWWTEELSETCRVSSQK